MEHQFNTPYRRVSSPAEQNSGEVLVDRLGYASAEKRITSMMLAGQRLVESRRTEYDFNDDKIDFNADPTRRKDIDMVDVDRIARGVIDRLNDQKLAHEQKLEQEKQSVLESSDAQE